MLYNRSAKAVYAMCVALIAGLVAVLLPTGANPASARPSAKVTHPQTVESANSVHQAISTLQSPRGVIATDWIVVPCMTVEFNARVALDPADGQWRVIGRLSANRVAEIENGPVSLYVQAPNGVEKITLDSNDYTTNEANTRVLYEINRRAALDLDHGDAIVITAHVEPAYGPPCARSLAVEAIAECTARIVDPRVTNADGVLTWSGQLEVIGMMPDTINENMQFSMKQNFFTDSDNITQISPVTGNWDIEEGQPLIWQHPEIDGLSEEEFLIFGFSDVQPAPTAMHVDGSSATWDLRVALGETPIDGNPVSGYDSPNSKLSATFLWSSETYTDYPCGTNLLQASASVSLD